MIFLVALSLSLDYKFIIHACWLLSFIIIFSYYFLVFLSWRKSEPPLSIDQPPILWFLSVCCTFTTECSYCFNFLSHQRRFHIYRSLKIVRLKRENAITRVSIMLIHKFQLLILNLMPHTLGKLYPNIITISIRNLEKI